MKRDCGVLIRFTQEERDNLTEKARRAGLSREHFCRDILNGAEIKEAPPAKYYELIQEVRRTGYNINQLLKIANARGLMDAPLIRKALEENRATEQKYEYDENGNLVGETDANGGVTSYTYDGVGMTATVTRSTGGIFTNEYDKNSQVVQWADSLENSEKYNYNGNGNLVEKTNRRGYKTTYEYDADDRLVKTTDALGFVTIYTYLALRNIQRGKPKKTKEQVMGKGPFGRE